MNYWRLRCELIIVFITLTVGVVEARIDTSLVVYSQSVQDSFLIRIQSFDELSSESEAVYYPDLKLRFGRLISEYASQDSLKKIFIGIGHFGDFKEKRRRDFIAPYFVGNDTVPDYLRYYPGRAFDFLSFLRNELIPLVEKNVTPHTRTFIGHSFGGLFGLYAANQDSIFQNIHALSPSVWVNRKNFIEYWSYYPCSSKSKANLYVGGLEVFNRVKRSVLSLSSVIKSSSCPDRMASFEVIPWAGHNSYLAQYLPKLLNKL